MIEVKLSESVWADVEEGTEALLQEWQVNAGDAVAEGQVLGVAELVKTTHEIVAPAAGRIAKLAVAPEETFGRDTVLALIEE